MELNGIFTVNGIFMMNGIFTLNDIFNAWKMVYLQIIEFREENLYLMPNPNYGESLEPAKFEINFPLNES